MHAKFEWHTIHHDECGYTHNQHNTRKNKKHWHHDLPCPLASSGFNLIGECDHLILCDQSQSPQHGDVIFIDETNIFFILLTIILQASDQRACELNVSFISDYLFFFLAVASKQCALTPAICWYFFADVFLVLVKFCHDFVLGWGGAMVAIFTLSFAAQVGRLCIVE